jgi:hypothetical protein
MQFLDQIHCLILVLCLVHYELLKPTEASASVDKFLSIFKDCIVHLINYEGTDFPFPSISEIALVSSQYDGRVERNAYNRLMSIFSPTSGPRNFSQILKLHLCPRSCNCEAQFYLRPPTQVNSSLVATINSRERKDPQLHVPQEYFNSILHGTGGLYNLYSLTHSRLSYHILIAKEGKDDCFLWEFAMSGIVGVYPNTRLAKVTEDERKLFLGERSFGLGAKVRRFSEVEIVANLWDLEKTYRHLNLGRGKASMWAVKLGDLSIQREESLQSTDDFLLFQKVIGNFTLIQPLASCQKEDLDRFSCDRRLTLPTVNLKESNSLSFIRSRDRLTFLSCGRTSSTGISFIGFISAFDVITWGLILSSYVGLRALICVWLDFRVVVAPKVLLRRLARVCLSSLDILLEQGDSLWGNNKLRLSWLYWISSGLLLGGLVLSNFYRGENISALSAPLGIKPLTSFEELLQFNYTIYSKIFVNMEEILTLELTQSPSLYNSSEMNQYTELSSYFHGFDPNVVPLSGHKLMEMIWKRMRFDPEETLQLAKGLRGGNYSFEGTLLKCRDVSIIGWEAKVLRSLAERVRLKLVGLGNNVILSEGKEALFMGYEGWSLTGWIDSDVFGRLQRGLVESGVSDEALLRRTKIFMKGTESGISSDSEGSLRMGLKGNTVSIFGVWGFGLILGVGVFFAESVTRAF